MYEPPGEYGLHCRLETSTAPMGREVVLCVVFNESIKQLNNKLKRIARRPPLRCQNEGWLETWLGDEQPTRTQIRVTTEQCHV